MRDKLPGEDDPFEGTRDAGSYLSRVVHGQLSPPDNTNGKVQVQTNEVIGVREVTVPVLWFTGKGRNSSWGRYMPQGGENVHVAYRNDDSAVVVGYDANHPGEGDPQEGWQFLNSLYQDQAAGYSSFKVLKPGEFDFKSAGDVYIHGSFDGTLYLAGGQAFIRLRKQSYTIDSKASAYKFDSETSTYRFGTVFRSIDPTSPETPVNMGGLKEFMVDVNIPIPGAGTPSPQSAALLHMGDIVNDLNIIEDSQFGAPLRFKLSLGDSLNLNEVFSVLVDNNGDVDIKQLKPFSQDDNTLSWQVGFTTITVGGVGGTFDIKQVGAPTVSVAIADHLETLWGLLKQAMDIFDTHLHPTAVGPSGPPNPISNIPAWNSIINSTKVTIPDG